MEINSNLFSTHKAICIGATHVPSARNPLSNEMSLSKLLRKCWEFLRVLLVVDS